MKRDVNKEEVVISGVGGAFPKCHNIEEFKQRLLNNERLQGQRWKTDERGVTNVIGTIPDINLFDTSFFSIHRAQCNYMDPMQRLVLERTYEALIDAGLSPTEMRGKKVAVYTSSCVAENDNLFYESMVSGFEITGHTRSMMANRISYWLNLKGPSCAYEDNWLGGTQALQAGCEAVREGFCEGAIVATANLTLNAELSWLYNDMGLLSQDGLTKPFDKDANGYGRSDSIVVLYLQRAADAHRIYASVLGVESIFSGNREGVLCKVDTNDMSDYLREFYSKCKVNPADVGFMECYGVGQAAIDEAEIAAIDRVCGKDREEPLLIGSVKSNAGHAEASAVFVSLVKVLIAMETGIIPANINYDSPNTRISALTTGRVKVVDKNMEWNGNLAAVNCIGIGSSYGHILLKANPKIKKAISDEIPRLITLSTRTEEGIQKSLNVIKAQTTVDPEYVSLIHHTYSKAIHGHMYRGYVVLDNSEETKADFEYCSGNKTQIWFVYSGMGSQWCKMASDLMELPLFAASIHKCHQILQPKGVDLLKIVTSDDATMFDNILHSFVGIAAVQIALTDVLHAIGIIPDGIIGHSVGELGCAYADGCLTAEQMILAAYSRGRASQEADLVQGMMAAIGKGYNQMKDICPPSIEVACHNGPDSCTISGPTKDMEIFVKELQDQGTFARLVNVSNIAYHSQYIKPAAPLLLKYLQEVIPDPQPRSSKWISTSIPENQWNSDLAKTSSAEYHTNNLLSFVLFEEGSKHIPKEAIVVEIAPHGLLQAILKRSLNSECTNVPLTHKSSKNGLQFLLSAIGKLYLSGLELNLAMLYPPVEYPVSRGTASLTPLINWEHSEQWDAGIEEKVGYSTCAKDLSISLLFDEYKYLSGNQLRNNIAIPVSFYLTQLTDILAGFSLSKLDEIFFDNMRFDDTILIPKAGSVPIQLMVRKGSGEFDLWSENIIIGCGSIKVPDTEKIFSSVLPINLPDDRVRLTGEDVYQEFSHRGYTYEGIFRIIKNLDVTKEGSVGTLQWNNCWENFVAGMLQLFLFHKGERQQNILMVSGIQRIVIKLSTLPSDAADLQVTYDYATGIIWTEGIQISGIKIKPLILKGAHISIDSVELVSLNNVLYQNIESGLNFGLHLALNNFDQYAVVDSIMVIEIETTKPSLYENIKNVVNKFTKLKANISTVKDSGKIMISPAEPMLVIVNDKISDDCVKLLTASHIFMLAHKDRSITNNPAITQVAQFSVNGISYSILRKRSTASPIIVEINSSKFSADDYFKETAWAVQLKTAVATTTGDKKVYLVSTVVPAEGIYNFVKNICFLSNMNNVRFVFVLDKNAPTFSNFEPVYQRIFKDNLILTVIQNGFVATYLPSPTEFKEDALSKLQAMSNVVGDKRFNYLGVNISDETLMSNAERKADLGVFDYSAATSLGDNVMGIAHFDTTYSRLVPDSILSWDVPWRWSLPDAATVPYAYSMAYYSLVILGDIQSSDTVLIHGGCTPLGLAAISVAVSYGCTILATVTSDFQKAFIKKQFCFMGDRNIFNARNMSFEPRVMMATGGQGAHIVVNCLSRSLLNATLRCVAEFGTILHVGKVDLELNSEIGMKIFLRNVSLHSITGEDIFNSPPEIKKKLYKLVNDGLDKLTIRPLHKIITESRDCREMLKLISKPDVIGKVILKLGTSIALSQVDTRRPNQYVCDANQSYLVYGGNFKFWIDMVEWLIFRGAIKVVVAVESISEEAYIKRRLNILSTYWNADIKFASSKINSPESILKLLSTVQISGEIGAVFILPSNNLDINVERGIVQYFDSGLKCKATRASLVNFVQSAAGICHLRNAAGYSANNVQWESGLKFDDILYGLDEILNLKLQDGFIKNDQLKDVVHENVQSLYKKLHLLLPRSVDYFKDEASIVSSELDFIQIQSLSVPNGREVPPAFMIPGMFQRHAVQQLASNLLCPVYYASYSASYVSIEKVATQLVNKMKLLCPEGPYNIIGISYGGVLALQIAKCLEELHNRTRLYLIDGAPQTIQGILRHLGDGPNRDIGLLCRTLNLTNPEITKTLTTLPEWERRLKFSLDQYSSSSEDKVYLSKALTSFRKYIDDITAYQPNKKLLSEPICLLRPSDANKYDECGLSKFCSQNSEISVVNGDHISILTDKLAANTLNNRMIC